MDEEELQGIVEKMVSAGEPEENIALVIKHHKPSKAPVTTQKEEAPETGSVMDYVNAGVGAFNRGVSTVISAPLKFIGHTGDALASAITGEEVDPNANLITSAGQAVEDFTNKYNPRYDNVNETYQAVGEGLGQGAGMLATAGLGTASKGLQAAETVSAGLLPTLGRTAIQAGKLAASPTGFIAGSMTAAPEWEAAKQAGLSDEDAFGVMMKNYLIGQTEALPIQSLLGRLNKVTGNRILNTVKSMGMGGIEEGTQEAIQTYLTNEVAKEDYDPDRDPLFQVLESAKVGGIVGFILPGIGGFAKNLPADKRVKLERKLAEVQLTQETESTGDPELDAEIDAPAHIDPIDKQVLEERKVAGAVQQEHKEIEADEKIQEDLQPEPEGESEGVEVKPTQTPEYKEAVDKVEKLRQKFADLSIEDNADELLFDLREARHALQKIAGKPKDTRKKTDLVNKIEQDTGAVKPDKSIKLTPNEAIKTQIQTLNRGIKEGRLQQKDAVNETVKEIQQTAKDNSFSPKQLSTILTRVRNTNLHDDASVEKLNQFVDKVTTDANYAENIDIAETARKAIKTRSKSKPLGYKEKQALKDFALINPDEVDVNQYNQVAETIKNSFRSVKDASHKPLSLKEVNSYVEKEVGEKFAKEFPDEKDSFTPQEKVAMIKEKQLSERAQNIDRQITDEAGVAIDDETAAEDKKAKIKEDFKKIALARKEQLPNLENLSTKEAKHFADLKNANLDDLTTDQLRNFIKVTDRITENEDTTGLGTFAPVVKAYENLRILKDKLKSANILNLNNFEAANTASLPAAFQAIYGLAEDAATFQLNLGIKGVSDSTALSHDAESSFVDKMNDMHEKFDKIYGTQHNGFTDESIIRQGIYGELIRYSEDVDPDEAFKINKQAIETSFNTLRKIGKDEDAATIERLYKPFADSESIQEVQDILQKIDPAGKKVVDFIIDFYKPYGDTVTEYNNLYHNKPTVKVINYTGTRSWRTVEALKSGKDIESIEDLDSMSFNTSTPKQIKSAREFKNLVRKDAVLNFNLHKKAADQIRDVVFKTEATPYMLQVREMLKHKDDVLALLGYDANSKSKEKAIDLYDKMFDKDNGIYFSFENESNSKTNTPTAFEKDVSKVLNVLRTAGYTMTLSGLSQVPKQATVLANTAIQLGSDADLLFSSIGDLIKSEDKGDAFFTGEALSMRGKQKALFNIGDLYTPELNKNIEGSMRSFFTKSIPTHVQKVFEGWTGLKPLIMTDVSVAKATYLSFYKQYLKKYNTKYEGLTKENSLRDDKVRQEARAYAKQRVDILQVVSNPSESAKVFKKKGLDAQLIKSFLMPFGTFGANTKERLWADYRGLINGNKAQKKAAARDIAATFAEQATFQSVNVVLRLAVFGGLLALAREAFGLDDEEDKEGLIDKISKQVITATAKDNLPLILTEPGEKVSIDLINEAAFQYHNWNTGEAISRQKFDKEIGGPLVRYKPREEGVSQILDIAGVYGAPIEKLIQATDLTTKSLDEDLTPEQKRLTAFVAFLQWSQIVGAVPADVSNAFLREQRNQAKAAKEGAQTINRSLPRPLPKPLIKPRPLPVPHR